MALEQAKRDVTVMNEGEESGANTEEAKGTVFIRRFQEA